MRKDNKYSDDRLLQDLCREGVDKDAFERLFHRYYPMVLNFVKGLVKNSAVLIKVLGNGDLTKKVTVAVDKVSASAKEKIEKIGGTVTEANN